MFSVSPMSLKSNRQEHIAQFLRTTSWENCDFMLPSRVLPERTLSDFCYTPQEDVLQDLRFVVDRLQSLGLETLALDMTLPDVGLPVARVVVPGLRHFWRRLAPGRLYDVPVNMGWQSVPTEEADVNPLPMLI